MWESLPIQTRYGEDGMRIQDKNPVKRDPNVQIQEWKDVPKDIREWCLSTWKREFGIVRDPMEDGGILGWIHKKGMIVLHHGRWVGSTRSRSALYVKCLYVEPQCRKEGVASLLIQSIIHEGCSRWGESIGFLFEVDSIPSSLVKRKAIPVCRYNYIWIPFLHNSEQMWKEIPVSLLEKTKGFHGNYSGWKAFQCGENEIVLDASNDIVWYTSWISLFTFDGMPLLTGAYCRVFTPFGRGAVFSENMYVTPMRSLILG